MNFLAIVVVICTIIDATVTSDHVYPVTVSIKDGEADIDIGEKLRLHLSYNGENVYNEPIGSQMPLVGNPEWIRTSGEFLSVWENGLRLRITDIGSGLPGVRVEWTAPPTLDSLQDCFDLGLSNWYGGAELQTQPWPIQNNSFLTTPFIPNAENGGVLERYFLSPKVAYHLEKALPLFVSLDSTPDNKTLCFRTAYAHPYRNSDGRLLTLTYDIIPGSDLLDIHRKCSANFFGFPSGIPMKKVFRQPIWSTWVTYRKYVNQTKVMQFARAIEGHGFPACQIELDDSWEAGGAYGVEVFDNLKFPNPIGMVNSLKLRGFDVTLWVHPFVNVNSSTFDEGDVSKYFVRNYKNNSTAVTAWRDGDAGVIDVTRPEATEWWAKRLDRLQRDVGISSFKFDAGENEFLPVDGYYDSNEGLHPGIFSTQYANFASRYGNQIEVRVGYGTQKLPVFVRLLGRNSDWSLAGGLRSIITSSLHLGIVGYPFVLPDMIGGNGYGNYPTKELFIRWVQVNAFLPVMQFSLVPWSFDEETSNISLKMVELHRSISDVIVAAAHQSTMDGSPIIRPIWWIAPNDTTAQTVNDQFLVGDQILVAPILTEGATERNIYFPEGKWKDELDGQEITGPGWLENYQVSLDQIPYFSNLSN